MRQLIVGGLLLLVSLMPAMAAERGTLTCLSRQDMHGVIAAEKVVAPNAAVRIARAGQGNAELVRVRLCRHDDDLVYIVTFLRRDGRIAPVTVDALSGRLAAR